MIGKALVLGGGGVTGVGWEIGLLAGLAERGFDLSTVDRFVGTSAGSIVAVHAASGADLSKSLEAQLTSPPVQAADRIGLGILAGYIWAALRSSSPSDFAIRIGRIATSVRTVSEAERRERIGSRLPTQQWPATRLLITAVDIESGEQAVFDRDSGVALVDAVAASCAVPGVWPPVTIGGRRYMDGGMRSPANANLAIGCARVLVVAPIVRGLPSMASVRSQVAELERSGSTVAVLSPDARSRRAIGRNTLDTARRAPAARAGYAQAPDAMGVMNAAWARAPDVR